MLLNHPRFLESFVALFDGLTFNVLSNNAIEAAIETDQWFDQLSKELTTPTKEKPTDFAIVNRPMSARPKSDRPKTLPLQSVCLKMEKRHGSPKL